MSSNPYLRSITRALAAVLSKLLAFFSRPLVKKRLRITAYAIGSALLLVMILWFSFRNQILQMAWEKAVDKTGKKGYTLTCTDKSFSGIFTVGFDSLHLHRAGSTLFFAEKLSVSVDIWKSLWNGPSIGGIKLINTSITAVNNETGCNYCGLMEKNERAKKSKDPLVQQIFNLIKRGLAKVPGTIQMQNVSASYRDTGNEIEIMVTNLKYAGNDLIGSIGIKEQDKAYSFKISGELDRSDITGSLVIEPEKQVGNELPFLNRRFGLSTEFRKADFRLENFEMSGGVLEIKAQGYVNGISVKHKRISDTNVVIQECAGTLVARLGKDFIEIDSSSNLKLNKISTFLYAKADLGKHKMYDLKFRAEKIKATDFFASLPQGMFQNLIGIKVSGELEYRMAVHLDDKKPYDCTFSSELKPYDFKILEMGETNLRKMNGEFRHTFYDHGKAVRSFIVGPSNSSFTPISQIPDMIQKAVMTGEDPAFFSHNGFYAEAIRQSIAQNYVRKRFARGGSTISMQLVKNVFLSRKKTLARKAEEILIVWLIEGQRLTSKSRMMEVYLNIIEWGPGVFGIGEASQFYFAKPTSALEPLECAFLASIVPNPKSYAYFVDSAGYVSQKNWNFVAIRNNMIKRGDISAADSGSFNVKITGPAARGIRRPKQIDTVYREENEELLDLGQ
ncbi:MAG: hypothetical protein RLZZ161_1791 [Bacteroidota bacterium]|jgi:hypothetical protein